MGTIVLVTTKNTPEQWTVVDGQQRLSTTLILLSVIRDIFNEMKKESDVSVIRELIESEDEDGNKSIRLKMSVNNDDFFKDHVMKLGIPSEKIGATQRVSKRNKNLAIAYSTIFDILNGKTKKMLDQEKTKFLIKFYNHFAKYCVVIRNIIDTPDRAYRIFDSINNRGVELAESDLVKNFLLETIDYGQGDVDAWHEKWIELLKILDKAGLKERVFFRHYLISSYGPTDQKGVFRRVTEEITNMQGATEFITRLLDAAQLYSKLKKPDHTNWFGSQEIVNDLKTFNDLNAMVIYPVLLKGFSIYGGSEYNFSKLVKILLTFFFRSRTISKARPTSLESLMNDICKEMRNNPHLQICWIKEKLQKSRSYPSTEKFKFDFSIFDANSKNAPYILASLNNEMHRQAGDSTNMTKHDVSLEHIMPETLTNNEWTAYIRDRKKLKTPSRTQRFPHKLFVEDRKFDNINQTIFCSKKYNIFRKNKDVQVRQN